MKKLWKAVAVAGMVAAMSPSLQAQWKNYPTRGVPRTPTGEPDLNAPAPRTPDGKVDFTGIWQAGRGGGPGGGGAQRGGGGGGGGGQRGGARGAAPVPDGGPRGAAAPGPSTGAPAPGPNGARGAAPGQGRGGRGGAPTPVLPPDGIPIATFANAGQGFPDGLPFQPWAADLVKQRQADNSKDNPDAHCLPMGFMQFHNHPEPRKIIQTRDVMAIIYEANSGLRQIFMDGRSLPDADAEPWWYGYSVGKWEGDTLVVETRGFRDGGWLDVRGSPLTDAAKVTEKFRRPNFGTLDIEITVDDPKAYTKPWTVRIYQRIMVDSELIEFICEDRDATHYVGAEQK